MTTPKAKTTTVKSVSKPVSKPAPAKKKLTEEIIFHFEDISTSKPAFDADGTYLNKSKELLLQLDSGAVVTGFVYEFSRDQAPIGKKGDLMYSSHYGVKLTGVIGWANLPG